jgi:hypothetical protein
VGIAHRRAVAETSGVAIHRLIIDQQRFVHAPPVGGAHLETNELFERTNSFIVTQIQMGSC